MTGSSDDLPSGTHPVCPRCGATAGQAVWCDRCGLNLRQQGPLPSADAYGARIREELWLAAQARGQEQRQREERQPSQAAGPEPLITRTAKRPLWVLVGLVALAGAVAGALLLSNAGSGSTRREPDRATEDAIGRAFAGFASAIESGDSLSACSRFSARGLANFERLQQEPCEKAMDSLIIGEATYVEALFLHGGYADGRLAGTARGTSFCPRCEGDEITGTVRFEAQGGEWKIRRLTFG